MQKNVCFALIFSLRSLKKFKSVIFIVKNCFEKLKDYFNNALFSLEASIFDHSENSFAFFPEVFRNESQSKTLDLHALRDE